MASSLGVSGAKKISQVATPESRVSLERVGEQVLPDGSDGDLWAMSEEPINYQVGWEAVKITSITTPKKLVEI